MSKNTIITILILAVLAIGGYLLLTSAPAPVSVEEEESLADVDYLLDNSVFEDINDALTDVLSLVSLDKQALAAEAGDLENIGGFEYPAEIDQYLNEVLQ